jgi:hypothetical protein
MATDFSGCIEMTAAYANFHYLRDRNFVISFDCTGNGNDLVYGKDSTTATDITKSTFFLEEFQLSCTSGGSYIGIYDGSGGSEIMHPIYCVSGKGGHQTWNFEKEPLRCLTAESTQSLCISATQNGFITGYIKGHWGTG